MSYFLTEEQILMRNTVKEFAEGEVRNRIAEIEKSNQFPLDLWKRCAELGLTGIAVDEKFGGLGLDVTTELLVMEELAKELPALALILDAHMLGMRVLEMYANEEQKQKYLVPGATGEKISAFGITDPAGSSNFSEWTPLGVFDGDEIVLNNTKLYVTNSQVADFYIFNGFIDGTLCYVIIDKGTPGLEDGHIEHKMGLAGTSTGTVSLRNVRVPKANYMAITKPPVNQNICFLNITVIALGLAEAALEKTKQFVLNRTRMGQPLASFQVVAHHIAEMATKIEFSRNMIYNAAKLFDEGTPNVMLARMAKAKIPDWVVEITSQCIQLHGGAGYCVDTGIERYMRDAKGLCIGEFPTDCHYDVIALQLGMPIKTT
ncbi:MAG: acyl-CoA dehydrogenase family protein [Dehalobacterium sp.]